MARAGGAVLVLLQNRKAASMEAMRLRDLKTLNLVFDEQLTTLQFGNLEVIGRRMIHGLGELLVEGTMLPL
jgi:hypothetical protein